MQKAVKVDHLNMQINNIVASKHISFSLLVLFILGSGCASTSIKSNFNSQTIEELRGKKIAIAESNISFRYYHGDILLTFLPPVVHTAVIVFNTVSSEGIASIKDQVHLLPINIAKRVQASLVDNYQMKVDSELGVILKNRSPNNVGKSERIRTPADYILKISATSPMWELDDIENNYTFGIEIELINVVAGKTVASFPCIYNEKQDGKGYSDEELVANAGELLFSVNKEIEATCSQKFAAEIVQWKSRT